MKAIRIVLASAGVLLVFLGLVFLIGGRPVTGAIILLAGGFMIASGFRRGKPDVKVVREELELSGDVRLENLKCRQCGASLSSDNTTFRMGTVFVSCPYCHSEYQLEEAPKW